ncbi:hypothetical protein Cs7R123_09610 [Catellatospora sp. TT07R-123]|uniref:hypothetical protein n=1 Tax=Catellatospora sp. TT07R-123 TaxID=2733863 RepID=UPI001B2DE0AD|nr:hypothetical protein [Catellatospora sp. TT07R-123]GHJ43619.1 hypothetical protein Cs7R123_09610 [Catellatospora sp. TT07R-123]
MTSQTDLAAAPAPAVAQRHLLSWVRDGLAGRLTETDPGSGPIRARATLATGLTVNGAAVTGPKLALHGPGDVTGVDPRQIVRSDPAPGAKHFESTHFALVEFDDPGLPWRLTPAAAHPQKGLRPWLVLVVVDTAAAGVSLETDPRRPLPVLNTPLAELPDLSHAASWAHAEVVAAEGEDIAKLLAERPERTVSRLISPRTLADGHTYLACVVPAFEHGRLAGLGDPVPATELTDPAWTGTTGSVRLPVYHHWTFSTGADGDFTALAKRLRPAVVDPGWKKLYYRDADPELAKAVGADPGIADTLPALTAPGAAMTGPIAPGFAPAMATILGRTSTVTAPLYLGAHIGHGSGWTGTEPQWLRQLNTDPRLRAAAGLGAEVIRIHQEPLMSAAWQQAAELAEVNRELHQGQVGRAVSESLHRRYFTPAGTASAAGLAADGAAQLAAAAERADTVVARTARALGRIPSAQGTVAAQVDTHESTAAIASADVQRVVRPTGPTARAAGATPLSPLASGLSPAAAGTIVPAPPVQASSDAGVLDRYTGGAARYRDITAEVAAAAPKWWTDPYASALPLVTPGPLGYLTDLVVMQENAAHSQVTATLLRTVDFDGRARQQSFPFPVPADTALPAVKLVGGVVHRIERTRPVTMLLGVRPGVSMDTWDPCIRAMPFDDSGTPAPTPYTVLPFFRSRGLYGADVTLRRRAGQPDTAAELVLLWSGADPDGAGAISTCSYQLDTRAVLRPQRNIRVFTGYVPSDLAADLIPITVRAGQPYAEPTDVAVAFLNATYSSEQGPGGPIVKPIWEIDWVVGRNFGTAQESWTDKRSLTLGDRVDDDTTSGQLSLSVTDLDGDGDPELVVHLTFDERQATGPARRVHRQRIGFGLHPDGTVEHWEAPIDLPITSLAPDSTVAVFFGDLDNQRLGRVKGIGDTFQRIAEAHQRLLIRDATRGVDPPMRAAYEIGSVAAYVSDSVNPAATIPAAVADRIGPLPTSKTSLAATGTPDPLRPRLYEPDFAQAMAEPLRELFPDLVFPGADGLPDDSVALMAGNGPLIAAYLAGLNHEFGRELLWRGFPSGGRATWFRRFFDASAADPAAAPGDITDIATWGTTGGLGAKVVGPAATDSVILLVRGELLRRYPDVVVQAAPAITTAQGRRPDDTAVQLPVFTGRAGADVTLFSFNIASGRVRGDSTQPGWFFIFAEPPTEPRFAGTSDWTQAGAHTAASLLRMPFRVAVHASDLIDPTTAALTPGAEK